MKLSELLGKEIEDVLFCINDYEYDGSIPLDQSHSIILLKTGETVGIPYSDVECIDETPDASITYQSLFAGVEGKNSFADKLWRWAMHGEYNAMWHGYTENIKNRKITGIYSQCADKDGYPELDKLVIELDSKYLIGEITMAPKGTGRAGLWVFTGMKELHEKFGNGFKKLY